MESLTTPRSTPTPEPAIDERLAQAQRVAAAPEQPVVPPYPIVPPNEAQPRIPPGGIPPYTPYGYGLPRPPQPPRRRSTSWVWWVTGIVLGIVVVLGLIGALIAGLVNSIWSGVINGPRYTVQSSQTFTVTGTPSVVIRDTAGNVTVRSGDTGQVTVQVTKVVRGLANDSARRNSLNNLPVTLSQSGNTVNVTADFQSSMFDGMQGNRTVDLLITVPSTSDVRINASAGNIDITRVTGVLSVDASAGQVTVRDAVFGDGSRVNTAAGNVTLDGALAAGASLNVDVSAGQVNLTLPEQTTHTSLDARVAAGNITMHGWSVPVNRVNLTGARASGSLGSDPHGTVQIRVATGNIDVRQG